jgi:ABC-type molybdate transport system substrate-binding protein
MRAADRWLSIPIAVLVIATTTSPTWSREKQARHHARVPISQRIQSGAAASQKEPFTAEEKRRFQAPTGHEVDRW